MERTQLSKSSVLRAVRLLTNHNVVFKHDRFDIENVRQKSNLFILEDAAKWILGPVRGGVSPMTPLEQDSYEQTR